MPPHTLLRIIKKGRLKEMNAWIPYSVQMTTVKIESRSFCPADQGLFRLPFPKLTHTLCNIISHPCRCSIAPINEPYQSTTCGKVSRKQHKAVSQRQVDEYFVRRLHRCSPPLESLQRRYAVRCWIGTISTVRSPPIGLNVASWDLS